MLSPASRGRDRQCDCYRAFVSVSAQMCQYREKPLTGNGTRPIDDMPTLASYGGRRNSLMFS